MEQVKQRLSDRIRFAIGEIRGHEKIGEIISKLRGARINLRNLANEVAKLEIEAALAYAKVAQAQEAAAELARLRDAVGNVIELIGQIDDEQQTIAEHKALSILCDAALRFSVERREPRRST